MDDRTAEILSRFNQSWNETESFYDELIDQYESFHFLKPLRLFMMRLREKAGDKFFRLGTSVHNLLISRSVEHGLRADQKYIKIEVIDACHFEVTFRDGNKIYRSYQLKSLEDIKLANLLQTLRHTLVD